jgi:hypothetical protein
MDRRGLLKVGMLGSTGLTLSSLLRHEAALADAGASPHRMNSVIILWMRGGPSQFETWDPKPNAPIEIRGEFSPIDTAVPGIQICEHLPRSARIMDKWSIIRSMTFRPEDGRTDHSSGDQVCFTGHPFGPAPDVNVSPSIGSQVKRQVQHLTPQMPAYVMIPRHVPGTSPAYLGSKWDAFETQADPAANGPFVVPNLRLAEMSAGPRMQSRRALLDELDNLNRQTTTSSMRSVDEFHQQAAELLTGTSVQKAFDLDSEPTTVRERYGFFKPYMSRVRAGGDAPNWPQRMLLARRLVEAGVRLVTVDCRWWDTHEDNFWSLQNGFLPRWDQAYSALIEDLSDRGLLDTTMVLGWGEMGRTPRINSAAGRDHWSQVMNVAVAGGGIKGGQVVGTSDRDGAVPKDNPKIVQDMLATVYRHLGVDTTQQTVDHAGRPHPILPCGQVIGELC